ncbi:hypothetical protein ACQBAT_05755 [Ornithinimicrobium sp. Y1847]|uniref:hypothetical protein n=1 Tax=Ornithinimicrobium sp. Y1847 TaxID=3405419 RepID=UPI003B685E5D
MSDAYTWSFENSDGTPLTDLGLASIEFPTQADAESWLSEEWPTLADAGVQSVTLRRGEDDVYGPMSLSPAD